MCFHPKFRENRKYYLFYQVLEDNEVVTRIVEREFDAKFSGDSGKPSQVIIRITSVADDHSGGCLEFGPEGYLYFVMGDTGPHHDPNGHAQNPGILLGKMMRIDVDRRETGLAYAIPKDNPFVGDEKFRPEIWAYGLRNPWRFCFDKKTQKIWLADVGQDRREEVNLIKKGGNYGWNVYEGFERFSNDFAAHTTHPTPRPLEASTKVSGPFKKGRKVLPPCYPRLLRLYPEDFDFPMFSKTTRGMAMPAIIAESLPLRKPSLANATSSKEVRAVERVIETGLAPISPAPDSPTPRGREGCQGFPDRAGVSSFSR